MIQLNSLTIQKHQFQDYFGTPTLWTSSEADDETTRLPPPHIIDVIQLNSLTIQVISFCIKHALVHQHYGRALKLMMKQQDYPPPI